MPNAPIIGGFNVLNDRESANERSINIMAETYNGKTARRLRATPGLRPFADNSSGLTQPIKGHIFAVGRFFVATENYLYEIFENGTGLLLGTIGAGDSSSSNPIQMASNGLQLILVNGVSGWGMDLSANIFTKITSPNFYPTKTITMNGGYAIGVRDGTQQFFHSDLYDVFTWLPSDFASAEVNPDLLVAAISDSVGVVMLGTNSLEIYVQTTDPVQVFQRRVGYSASYGCAAPYTAVIVNNAVVWVGQSENGAGAVYMLAGGIPSVISTPAIAEAIQETHTHMNKSTAFSYQMSSRSFYALTIHGSDTTYVYDFTEKLWHERRTFVDQVYTAWGRYKAENHSYAFNKNIVGSYDSGELYELDPDYYLDGTWLVRRERTMTPIYDAEGDAYGSFDTFGIDCIVGMGDANGQYADPEIALETSDDNGINFGYIRTKSLGLRGKRKTQLRWKRCGFSQSRVFRISMAAPVPFAIHRAWIE